jgi:hypothetical protein
MIRHALALLLSLALAVPATAQVRSARPDVQEHPECTLCGMDRETFADTRHLLEYEDGTQVGTCSGFPAPTRVLAADLSGKGPVPPLREVRYLTYALDPSKGGTMSPRSKQAYLKRADAVASLGEGGRPIGFAEAAREALAEVVDMMTAGLVRERRRR